MMRFASMSIRFALTAVALALVLAGPPLSAASVCGLAEMRSGPQDQALKNFAHDLGLRQVDAFVAVANRLHDSGRLPACYLTKRAAEAKGWRPRMDLWSVAPGAAIGGDSRAGRCEAKNDCENGTLHNGVHQSTSGAREL